MFPDGPAEQKRHHGAGTTAAVFTAASLYHGKEKAGTAAKDSNAELSEEKAPLSPFCVKNQNICLKGHHG